MSTRVKLDTDMAVLTEGERRRTVSTIPRQAFAHVVILAYQDTVIMHSHLTHIVKCTTLNRPFRIVGKSLILILVSWV